MTEPTIPSTPEGAGAPPASPPPASPPPTVAPPRSSGSTAIVWANFDSTSRMTIVAGATVVIAAALGVISGAWSLDPTGLIFIVLGLIVAGGSWVTASRMAGGFPVPALVLAASAVGAALSLLALIEMIADLDHLDEYGGPLGIVLAIIVTGASLAALWGCIRADADWRARVSGADQGTRIAWIGVGLVLLAWIWKLTVSYWELEQAAWAVGAIVLAGAILFVRDRLALPFAAAWIAAGLGLFAAIVALTHWGQLQSLGATRLELGIDDFIPFFVYVIGVLLVIGGSALTALGGPGAIRQRMGTDAGTGTGTT